MEWNGMEWNNNNNNAPNGMEPPKALCGIILDSFVDNMLAFIRNAERCRNIIHSHYADAGYGRSWHISLNVPLLVHTGHSLGRVKRRRLLATGLSLSDETDRRYSMMRWIKAEEMTQQCRIEDWVSAPNRRLRNSALNPLRSRSQRNACHSQATGSGRIYPPKGTSGRP
jgi:hypothetical protein